MATYFPEVKRKIKYEGPDSNNPLAFKYYNAKKKVGGKTMAQHLKFAVAYWHTFKGTGSDPFGGGVYNRPWDDASTPMEQAEKTLEAAFEFISKMGINYYCFHDRDIAPEGADIKETNRNLKKIIDRAEQFQKDTGIKLLWGTANVFSHPRYANGAATNPDPNVFAHAASQVKRAMDATIQLGGTGYVFWGGREGYVSLINTNMKQELDQLAKMLHMAVDYGRRSGFKGKYFIEPKPKEPSTHQYDSDSATVLGFLKKYGLEDDFMLNVEANHATLAGHTFQHDLQVASDAGMLGSLDINRGDPSLGWDTDQFPADIYDATWAMYILLRQGGLKYGGLNFDAKVRRTSFDTVDLFHAHIGGMDTFAKGLLVADKLVKDKALSKPLTDRYAGYKRGVGKKIMAGDMTLTKLEKYAMTKGEPDMISGRQEALENILNSYIYG